MKIDDDARLYLYWDGTLSADPTSSTIVLEIPDDIGSPFAMTWTGAAVAVASTPPTWTRTARTTQKFVGVSLTASGGDVALAAGRHLAQTIITTADGQTITGSVVPIDVEATPAYATPPPLGPIIDGGVP